ncbi:s-adenosyl-l-methionine-dependent methyltransferase [Malassezia pachydermatis]|uniref:S-adenosyl-l-methionine-dependent methyltransferase n=1 Tax=Malassezia pachydermatis TaxID=77020 RepID=A0A0M8MYT1_9BASI|nr:s-adenosyl-l-methionine-dependent methyltransferase [Malassezia pachydermatis]KOS16440.1 s-adenosyl-l-methionine-dependent methyltransferase [Malassezia pachydermatis]
MALVVNTLSYKETLQQVLASVDIAKREPKWFGPGASLNRTADKTRASGPLLSECLLLVLVHDLLFASRGIQAAKAWPPKERLEKYKSQLHAELVRLQIRRKKKSVEELRSGEAERKIAGRIPRWCRVNTLKVSQAEAINQLQKAGFTLVDTETLDQEHQFARSRHVRHVLAFHPKATSKLMSLPLFRTGGLILQDLASCFPAEVLDPRTWASSEVDALDATSAPGNKTSHLSALMLGQGTLTALERAPQRFKTLVKMLDRAGCLASRGGNVHPKKDDFLAMEPLGDGALVRFMLLDPSCSGSGIVNRLDYLTSQDDEQDNIEQVLPDDNRPAPLDARLASLAALQQRMIRHAMTFPSLERFTYSTCSVHEEENEHVVKAVLESPEAKEGHWSLAPRSDVLPTWNERGRPEACGGDEKMASWPCAM